MTYDSKKLIGNGPPVVVIQGVPRRRLQSTFADPTLGASISAMSSPPSSASSPLQEQPHHDLAFLLAPDPVVESPSVSEEDEDNPEPEEQREIQRRIAEGSLWSSAAEPNVLPGSIAVPDPSHRYAELFYPAADATRIRHFGAGNSDLDANLMFELHTLLAITHPYAATLRSFYELNKENP